VASEHSTKGDSPPERTETFQERIYRELGVAIATLTKLSAEVQTATYYSNLSDKEEDDAKAVARILREATGLLDRASTRLPAFDWEASSR